MRMEFKVEGQIAEPQALGEEIATELYKRIAPQARGTVVVTWKWVPATIREAIRQAKGSPE